MEVTNPKTIDEKGLDIIKEHMRLVAKNQPQISPGTPWNGIININPANIMVTC